LDIEPVILGDQWQSSDDSEYEVVGSRSREFDDEDLSSVSRRECLEAKQFGCGDVSVTQDELIGECEGQEVDWLAVWRHRQSVFDL
jgi:hypothetical protein